MSEICPRHIRNRKEGKPLLPFTRNASLDVRLWRKVAVGEPDACWEWQGSINSTGYGSIGLPGGKRTAKAHRVAWEVTCGPIPDGLFVCHACDNRRCCNPRHLFLGTNQDNIKDMVQKGRHGLHQHPERAPRGERQGASFLTEAIVREIRELSGQVTQRELAERFGTTQTNISLIVRRKNWGHVV